MGGGLGSDKRVAMRSMEGSRRVVVGTADTGQEFSHPIADWSIARRLCSKPVVQQCCAFGAHYFLFVSDQIAPAHGPHEIEIGICEKPIYPVIDFFLVGFVRECVGFVGCRQATYSYQEQPSNQRPVIGSGLRSDFQLLTLTMNNHIDWIHRDGMCIHGGGTRSVALLRGCFRILEKDDACSGSTR